MMNEDNQESRSIFSAANIVFIVFLVILGGIFAFIHFGTSSYNRKVLSTNAQITKLENQLNSQVAKNSKTIYLPNNKDLNLSTNQSQMVSLLNGLFTEATNYQTKYGYKSNYEDIKKHIPSGDLYTQLLMPPSSQAMYDIQSINVRTQVLVTGTNSYQVVVMYVLHHDNSDMTNPGGMNTTTKIFNVTGTAQKITSCTYAKDINTSSVVLPYSQFVN